ncbi:MAG: HIT domain-containing protein [Planctomycetes bacterium]|nr:HIT domain-containing protein [Planctomycetota bacterium]
MSEFQKGIWAPWRMEYIEQLADKPDGCFLCRYRDAPGDDANNHVLWRSERTLTLLNRFPYSNGHVLVAPTAHVAEPEDLPDEDSCELMRVLCDAKRVLQIAVEAHGFNIGINLGRCAGAGLPGHLHWHVVPRWNGDTNFMPVLAGDKVIPQALEQMQARFASAAADLGL